MVWSWPTTRALPKAWRPFVISSLPLMVFFELKNQMPFSAPNHLESASIYPSCVVQNESLTVSLRSSISRRCILSLPSPKKNDKMTGNVSETPLGFVRRSIEGASQSATLPRSLFKCLVITSYPQRQTGGLVDSTAAQTPLVY